jgi:5-formyltetrahydrofolate cyclo-ligase
MEVLDALRPTCVAAYFSTATEPSTDALLESLWARGIRVLTPRVQNDVLQWIETSRGSATEIGSFGIREVQSEQVAELEDAQAIVIPALAIDPMGFRLGQGGGFYDRALAAFVDPPLLIAVVHDREDLLDIPVESHDARMDVVVTERRIRYITPVQK